MELERVAGVILVREGAVLLQHRDDIPTIRFPGCWAIFGGHVEAGETPEDAARREVEEELCHRLPGPLTLVHHGRYEDEGRERFFFAAPLSVPVSELTLCEGQAMALLRPDEFDAYPLVPLHREILLRYFATASEPNLAPGR